MLDWIPLGKLFPHATRNSVGWVININCKLQITSHLIKYFVVALYQCLQPSSIFASARIVLPCNYKTRIQFFLTEKVSPVL